MLKILSVDQIRDADLFTIENEPIKSIDLMERAALNCTNWLLDKLKRNQEVIVFAGPGNNGGDGLVIARQLYMNGYLVKVICVHGSNQLSPDCQTNLKLLQTMEVPVIPFDSASIEIALSDKDLIIDALFGSGLTRSASDDYASAIAYINDAPSIVVSIDIPSGLFADKSNDISKDAIVQADYTLSLELPKHSFMFAENEVFVGKLEIVPIGLHQQFLEQTHAKAIVLQDSTVASLIKPRLKHSHKGHFGHALLIAGSYGKMGAAMLSANAAMRSGLGLLTMHIPSHGNSIIQTGLPEAMLSMDENEKMISSIPKDLANYNAIGIGPGLGKAPVTAKAFKFLIQESKVPLVIDADALNILADNPTYLAFLPAGSILTPHPGEFERLAGKSASSFERIEKQKNLAHRFKLHIVLKGAYTSIVGPDGEHFYNSTGNSGMSTAGSGDVLTGIILALMAQSYSPLQACILGVFLHGRAGDLSLNSQSHESIIASDIIENLGLAFKSLSTF